ADRRQRILGGWQCGLRLFFNADADQSAEHEQSAKRQHPSRRSSWRNPLTESDASGVERHALIEPDDAAWSPLPETIISKMIASPDGQYLFANSTTGLLVIPIGQLNNLPILDVSTTNV